MNARSLACLNLNLKRNGKDINHPEMKKPVSLQREKRAFFKQRLRNQIMRFLYCGVQHQQRFLL